MSRKTVNKKPPVAEQEIQLVVRETESLVQDLDPLPKKIRSLVMTSDRAYETLMEHGRVVRQMQREVEKKQKWATEGLKEAIKRVKSLFVPMITSCQSVLELIDQKQREYDRHLEQERKKEQARLDREAAEEEKRLLRNAKARARRRGDDPSEVAPPQVEALAAVPAEAPKVEGVSVAKVWDYEIIDPGKVPQNYQRDTEMLVLWEPSFNRKALMEFRRGLVGDDDREDLQSVLQTIEDHYGVRFFQKPVTRYGGL